MGRGVVYLNAICVPCGRTIADWRRGQAGWSMYYDANGNRIPNPHNIPGYPLPDEEVDQDQPADEVA